MGVRSTGFAKLLLFGEHIAVYGYPAVGLTLDLSLTLHLESGQGREITISGSSPELAAETNRFLRTLLEQGGLRTQLSGCHLDIRSEIPAGSGLGSSAALCTALAYCLHELRSGSPENELRRIWQTAHEMEAYFHGSPSGIDTGLATGAGIKAFALHPPALPRMQQLTAAPFSLVYGVLPRGKNTKELIRQLGERKKQAQQETEKIFAQLGKYTTDAIELLKQPESFNLSRLGALASGAQQSLKALGLSTPQLDELLGAGLAAGSPGGKLSGAGGGGAFYLLAGTKEAAASIKAALRKKMSGIVKQPFLKTFHYQNRPQSE